MLQQGTVFKICGSRQTVNLWVMWLVCSVGTCIFRPTHLAVNRCRIEGRLLCFRGCQHPQLGYLLFSQKLGKGELISSTNLCIQQLFAPVKNPN